jgi:hypothetical protein
MTVSNDELIEINLTPPFASPQKVYSNAAAEESPSYSSIYPAAFDCSSHIRVLVIQFSISRLIFVQLTRISWLFSLR